MKKTPRLRDPFGHLVYPQKVMRHNDSRSCIIIVFNGCKLIILPRNLTANGKHCTTFYIWSENDFWWNKVGKHYFLNKEQLSTWIKIEIDKNPHRFIKESFGRIRNYIERPSTVL